MNFRWEIGYILTISFCLLLHGNLFAQTDYATGNAAYNSALHNNFQPVTVAGGDFVYTYDQSVHQYRHEQYILIPDMTNSPNGNYMDTSLLYGHGSAGTPTDTAFQWDKQSLIEDSDFDVAPMFISPLSTEAMNYSTAMQYNQNYCTTDSCALEITQPDSMLAWPQHPPYAGSYEMWDGEELINAGDIKGTGTDSKHSQQQLDTGINASYCVSTYGPGWRLPTDVEMGHINDEEGTGNGFDEAFRGTSTNKYIWTCSLFKTYEVKRWPARVNDGDWENCAGFLYVSNYVRCVYPVASDVSTQANTIETPDISIYPNPARQVVYIHSKNKSVTSIELIRGDGKIIKKKATKNTRHLYLNTHEYSPGVYFIKIYIDNELPITKKILIKL
ncbi:MAG: T9SS type A sorting domain-containing protein [Bacteroidota bacterium]|nr:T9SS type A sorting domain-containing protein [Bacteroidota bacterium]